MRLLSLCRGEVFRVCALVRDSGRCDFEAFIVGLGANLQGDVNGMVRLLDRAAEVGPPRNSEICHQIAEGIWQFTYGRLRVAWFYDKGQLIICTHGFVKKSQKTKRKEIDFALARKREYAEAKRRGPIVFEEA